MYSIPRNCSMRISSGARYPASTVCRYVGLRVYRLRRLSFRIVFCAGSASFRKGRAMKLRAQGRRQYVLASHEHYAWFDSFGVASPPAAVPSPPATETSSKRAGAATTTHRHRHNCCHRHHHHPDDHDHGHHTI